jgi:hypothetical protein
MSTIFYQELDLFSSFLKTSVLELGKANDDNGLTDEDRSEVLIKSRLKTADGALVLMASAGLKVLYRRFRISPAVLFFYPLQIATAVAFAAHVDMAVKIDPFYWLPAAVYAFWFVINIKGRENVRRDAHVEWDAKRFRHYSALAELMREKAWGLRLMSIVLYAAVVAETLGLSSDTSDLYPAHRVALWIFVATLTAHMYVGAAELPEPSDGDRAFAAQPV